MGEFGPKDENTVSKKRVSADKDNLAEAFWVNESSLRQELIILVANTSNNKKRRYLFKVAI